MENANRNEIEIVWKQGKIPVIYRPPKTGDILIRFPNLPISEKWLNEGRKKKPILVNDVIPIYWKFPRSSFNIMVNRILVKYRSLYIIQYYNAQEKCASKCQNAEGFECECSCMGKYHGDSNPKGKWYHVSDTFATQWKGQSLAYRLLLAK